MPRRTRSAAVASSPHRLRDGVGERQRQDEHHRREHDEEAKDRPALRGDHAGRCRRPAWRAEARRASPSCTGWVRRPTRSSRPRVDASVAVRVLPFSALGDLEARTSPSTSQGFSGLGAEGVARRVPNDAGQPVPEVRAARRSPAGRSGRRRRAPTASANPAATGRRCHRCGRGCGSGWPGPVNCPGPTRSGLMENSDQFLVALRGGGGLAGGELQQLVRIDRDRVGVDAGGRRDRGRDDVRLSGEALLRGPQ